MGSIARGVHLLHIAKQTNDVGRLAQFYQENPILGFEGVWLKLPPSLSLHIREPTELLRGNNGPETPTQGLKKKGIQVYEGVQPDGRTKQVFFFDPDGNVI